MVNGRTTLTTAKGTFDFDRGPDFSRAEQLERQAQEEARQLAERRALLERRVAEQDMRTATAQSFFASSSQLAQASVPRARAQVLAPIQREVQTQQSRSLQERAEAQAELDRRAARLVELQGASEAERRRAVSDYNEAAREFNATQERLAEQERVRIVRDLGPGSFKKVETVDQGTPAILAPGVPNVLVTIPGQSQRVFATEAQARNFVAGQEQQVRAQNIKALATAMPFPSERFVRGQPELSRITGEPVITPTGFTEEQAKEFLFRPTAREPVGRVREFFGEEIGRPVVENIRQLEDFYGRGVFNQGGGFTRPFGTFLGVISAPSVVGQNLFTKEAFALDRATGGLGTATLNVARLALSPGTFLITGPSTRFEAARGVGLAGGLIGGASVSAGPEFALRGNPLIAQGRTGLAAKQLQPIVVAQTRVPAIDFAGTGRSGTVQGLVTVRQPTLLSKLVFGDIPSRTIGIGPARLPIPTRLAIQERTILFPFSATERTAAIAGTTLTKPSATFRGRSIVDIKIQTPRGVIPATGEIGFGQQTIDKIVLLEPSKLGSNFVSIAENRVFGEFRGKVGKAQRSIPFSGKQQVTTEFQALKGLDAPVGPIETRVTDLGKSVSKIKSTLRQPTALPSPDIQSAYRGISERQVEGYLQVGKKELVDPVVFERLQRLDNTFATPPVLPNYAKSVKPIPSTRADFLKLTQEFLAAKSAKPPPISVAGNEFKGLNELVKKGIGERGSIGGGTIARAQTQTQQLLAQTVKNVPVRVETGLPGIQAVIAEASRSALASSVPSYAAFAGGLPKAAQLAIPKTATVQIQKPLATTGLKQEKISLQAPGQITLQKIQQFAITPIKTPAFVPISSVKLTPVSVATVKAAELTVATPVTTPTPPFAPPPIVPTVPVLPPLPPVVIPPFPGAPRGTQLSRPSGFVSPESATGFEVFVKSKGKFVVANKPNTSLREQDALRFGEAVADNSTARSFVIRKSTKPVTRLSRPLPNVSFKFSPPKGKQFPTGTYTEKSQYGIDTRGEKRGLSVARALAQYRQLQSTPFRLPGRITKRRNRR